MKNRLSWLLILLIFTSCRQTFYVVRHGEKELPAANSTTTNNDPSLSNVGKQRAETLKGLLQSKKIGYVFSTNTTRTRSTAEPVRAYFNLVTEIYPAIPNQSFIDSLLSLKKNVLLVAHSNTIDDVVNKICGTVKIPADLPETSYDNLFVIRKKGKKFTFENRKYGNPSP